ncbi:MAG: alpha/beta fold hydrolase [Planctomycetota bacterium]
MTASGVRRYEEPCRPPLWARGGHAQTLLGHVLPSRGPELGKRRGTPHREVALDDGDRLLVFELAGTSGVRVLLMHGLSGDVNSEYMRRTAAAVAARGHGVWAVNHRGCGEGAGLARGTYHSGKTEDLRAVLAASRADAPELTHVVVGFSLSANLGLLHLASRAEPQPDGLIAVNPPADLHRASVDIGRGLSRLYELRFGWRLRRAIADRARRGLDERSYSIPLGVSLLRFDDLFTAPHNGFADGLDYYRRCSALPQLNRIETPAVIVTAGDDPFVDPSIYDGAELSPAVTLHVEPTGGHVGYLARRGLGWRRWLDGALLHYVDELAARR